MLPDARYSKTALPESKRTAISIAATKRALGRGRGRSSLSAAGVAGALDRSAPRRICRAGTRRMQVAATSRGTSQGAAWLKNVAQSPALRLGERNEESRPLDGSGS